MTGPSDAGTATAGAAARLGRSGGGPGLAPSRLPEPRAELGLRAGYHSTQAEVEVRLNTNESPYPPPAAWLEAYRAELSGIAWNRYPDRSASALRRALADLHGVRPDQVFAANGSNEVLQALCLAYGGPGRRAVVFEPTYALHAHIAHLCGTEVVEGARGEGFVLDPGHAAGLVVSARPSLTFLCSPNNPTGTVDDPSLLGALLAGSPGLVVVDEAYGQFAERSALEVVAEDVPVAVVRTFSKTWSLAALRLGYLVGPAEVVATLERVCLPYHLDAAKQAAGRLAVAFRSEMDQRVAALVAERDRLLAALGRLPVQVWPSQANFVLFRPLDRPGRQVWEELLAASVLVRDTSSWPGLEGCLRVTVGTPEEDDRFLAALAEACR
jgi:histidinol-phosphate aminotransferase